MIYYFVLFRVYKICVASERDIYWPERYQGGQWVTREQFLSSATSTAMKKVVRENLSLNFTMFTFIKVFL